LASGIISGGGSGVGKLLASLMFLVVSALLPGRLYAEWGWRVMFFSGLLSSLLGLFVFTRLQESPMWQALQQVDPRAAPHAAPAGPGLRGYLPVILLGIVLATAGGGLSYLTSGYLPTFIQLVKHVGPRDLGLMLSLSALAVIASSVLAGWLTDVIGRKPAMLAYAAASLLLVPLLYAGLARATSLAGIGLYAVALSAVGTFCYAPLLIVLNERFPTAMRARGTAVTWNIGFALGGSMPVLVSLVARASSGLAGALGVSTAVLAAAYALAAWRTPMHRNLMV
ncbi:MAG: MFS transporter, partial [Betaproteobacteria bacterium]|nr:MFS transporter [Betaproteobacteria bacterium]